jgi:hypothetical protein
MVLLMPIAFLTLYRRELLSRPQYAFLGLVLGGLLTVAATTAYLNYSRKSLDDRIRDTLSYNIYERGYGGYALNRTTALTFWARHQGAESPIALVFGHGVGASHDATGGHIARRYPGYGIGLTGASTLLWDLGVLGLVLFLTILGFAWRTAGVLSRMANETWVKADAAAIQATLPLFAFFLVYRLSLLETLSFQIVFYALLGYLAWLAGRRQSIA